MRTLLAGGLISCTISGCGAGVAGTIPTPAEAVPKAEAGTSEPVTMVAVEPSAPSTQNANDGAGAWIGAAASSDFLPTNETEHNVAIWVDVPQAAHRAHVPVALTLTIDTSGSMGAENKMAHARTAATRVVDGLADGDSVALHTFSDDVRVRVPRTVLTPLARRAMHSVIEELQAGGGTNLFDGVRLSEADTAAANATHSARRVVVISDGKATVGQTSPEAMGRIAEFGMGHGVQVTSFGVGLDYDESTLNALAMRSSGRLYHIADAAELPGMVERELALIRATMATDAFVDLVAAPGVTLVHADGASKNFGPGGGLRVPLGSMFAGQTRELLVRVRVADQSPGQRPLLSARLHFHDPADGGIERVQEVVARATLTDDSSQVAAHAHPRAQSISALQQAAFFAARASSQANTGDFDSAERELAQAEARLRDGARHAKTKEERARITSNAERMTSARRSLKAAAAAPAPKRAAVGRANALELNDAALDLQGY